MKRSTAMYHLTVRLSLRCMSVDLIIVWLLQCVCTQPDSGHKGRKSYETLVWSVTHQYAQSVWPCSKNVQTRGKELLQEHRETSSLTQPDAVETYPYFLLRSNLVTYISKLNYIPLPSSSESASRILSCGNHGLTLINRNVLQTMIYIYSRKKNRNNTFSKGG